MNIAPPTYSSGYSWYVVFVMMLLSVLAFVDRQILNLMVGPIRADLQISDTQISLLLGFAFALFYALCALPLGRLADSSNRRRLIAMGVVFWSLATAACGLAKSYVNLLIARMGVGAGEAVLPPAAFSLITDSTPKERLATALGVHSLGGFLGSGLAFALGGLVVVFAMKHGPFTIPLVGDVRPWQLVFLALGAAGLLLSLLLLTVSEPARGPRHAMASMSEVLAFLGRHRRTLLCHHFGFALLMMSAYSSAAWLPSFFVRVHGWDAGRFGMIYGAIVFLACSAGAILGGGLADRWQRQGRNDAGMRVGAVAAAASLPLGLWYVVPENAVLGAVLMIPAAFLAGMPAGVGPASLQQLVPANLRGQATALYFFTINILGLGLGPTLVALCTDYLFADDRAVGWSILIVCGSAQALACMLLWTGLAAYRSSRAAG